MECTSECEVFILNLIVASLGNKEIMILYHEAQRGGGMPAISSSADVRSSGWRESGKEEV